MLRGRDLCVLRGNLCPHREVHKKPPVLSQVVQDAMCPERRSGYDSALSAMASVTEVALSSDLQVAKIYLSIYSDDDGKVTAMKALSKLQG